MKNRLLEDIGESQSGVPARPLRPANPANPASPAPAGSPAARQRPGVWRGRTPAPELFVPSPAAAPPALARLPPDIAAFSSRQPDWSVARQPEPPPWTERWGRKALGWSLGLALAIGAAGTGAWMVHERELQSTLAVVAGHTPVQAVPDAPAVATAAPWSEPEPQVLPPLKLLPPEQAGAAPAASAGAGAEPEAGALKTVKPAAKRSPERRAAAAANPKRSEAGKPAPRPARERAMAGAPARPAAAPGRQPDPQSPLAETLRLCRAAGYHATACLKRGCEATRFGLVCRG